MTKNGNSNLVIFLAFANDPENRQRYLRQLRNEAEQLRDLLQEKAGDKFEVVVRQNVSLKNILDVFQNPKYKHRIAIFHFGEHADSYAGDGHRRGLFQYPARSRQVGLISRARPNGVCLW